MLYLKPTSELWVNYHEYFLKNTTGFNETQLIINQAFTLSPLPDTILATPI